ncbi:unnamed protein product [Mycena citricolor]|uniref:Uncharacterized protein n=1 Tax=Mycena citricolor TaxID=2018698 RepID=A0AAD2K5S1_9AGAR|nr:unnamed protein product [Mycena citricolor]
MPSQSVMPQLSIRPCTQHNPSHRCISHKSKPYHISLRALNGTLSASPIPR